MPRTPKTFQAKHIRDLDALAAAYVFHQQKGPLMTADAIAKEYPQAPVNVIYAKLRKLEDRGLLEVGTSLRGAWLTDAGYQKLMEEL